MNITKTLRRLTLLLALSCGLNSYAGNDELTWTLYKNGSPIGKTGICGFNNLLSVSLNSIQGQGADSVAFVLTKDVEIDKISDTPSENSVSVAIGKSRFDEILKASIDANGHKIKANSWLSVGKGVWTFYNWDFEATKTTLFAGISVHTNATSLTIVGGKYHARFANISTNFLGLFHVQNNLNVYNAELYLDIDNQSGSCNSSADIFYCVGGNCVMKGNTILYNYNVDNEQFYNNNSRTSKATGVEVRSGTGNVSLEQNYIYVKDRKASGICVSSGYNSTLTLTNNVVIVPFMDMPGYASGQANGDGHYVNQYGLEAVAGNIVIESGIYTGVMTKNNAVISIQSGYFKDISATNNINTTISDSCTVRQGDNKFYHVYYHGHSAPTGKKRYDANVYCGADNAYLFENYSSVETSAPFFYELEHFMDFLYSGKNALSVVEYGAVAPTDESDENHYKSGKLPTNVAIKYEGDDKYYASKIKIKDAQFYTPYDITVPEPSDITYTRNFYTTTSERSLGTLCVPFKTDGRTVDGNQLKFATVYGFDEEKNVLQLTPDTETRTLEACTPTFVYVGDTVWRAESKRWATEIVSAENVLHKFKSTDVDCGDWLDLVGVDSAAVYPRTLQDDSKYYFWAMNYDGKTLGWLDTDQKVNPMRAYVKFKKLPKDYAANRVKNITFAFVDIDEANPFTLSVDSATGDSDTKVDVYNIQGKLVRKSVVKADALNGLTSGVYVVGNKKYILR